VGNSGRTHLPRKAVKVGPQFRDPPGSVSPQKKDPLAESAGSVQPAAKILVSHVPPITPCAAMNATIILANLFSPTPSKIELAKKYLKDIEEMIERYKKDGDRRTTKYLLDLKSLILAQADYISEHKSYIRRRLEGEDELWASKKSIIDELERAEYRELAELYENKFRSLAERRTNKLKLLDELSSPVTLKGSIPLLIGTGGVASLLYAAQKEIMDVLASYIPGYAHPIYLALIVTVGAAVAMTAKFIDYYVQRTRNREVAKYNLEEEALRKSYKEDEQSTIRKIKDRRDAEIKSHNDAKARFVEDISKFKQERAAFVYLEAFKLCTLFYPEYTNKYKKYSELKEKDPETALASVKEHALELAKAEFITSHTKETSVLNNSKEE